MTAKTSGRPFIGATLRGYIAPECADGGPFHAVAEEAIPFRYIAEAIGRRINLPTKSIAPMRPQDISVPLRCPLGAMVPFQIYEPGSA